MKRFSRKEIEQSNLKIKYYDWFEYYAGYKVIDDKNNIVGYVTFNTACKLPKDKFIKRSF